MVMLIPYPMLMQPTLKPKVWGGNKLRDVMHKDTPTNEPYGEAWELHDSSVVMNGAMRGSTLGELVAQYGSHIIGDKDDPAAGFPLLAKFLDSNTWVSVQVHPNDEQAAELEGEPRGKTEAWYILQADPGAQLIYGVKPGTSREAMTQAIRDETLGDLLLYRDVEVGDVFFMEANTVHALGPGILMYEIQQSSDTTYRLYDWGRVGLDGKPRDLHIEKGVQVSNVESQPPITHTAGNDAPEVTLVRCPYFVTLLHQGELDLSLDTNDKRFDIFTCIDGSVTIAAAHLQVSIEVGTWQTALVPAAVGAYTVRGTGKVLRSFQP